MAFDVVTYALLKKSISNGLDNIPSNGMNFKGTVETRADLPTDNNQVGDMYLIIDSDEKAIWTGSAWVYFGKTPTKVSDLINDKNYISENALDKYRTKEDQDKIDVKKQDKLTTIGNNVHISDKNELLVDECKIGKTFITKKSIGHLPANTKITEDMTVADILYKILYADVVETINVYYGASTEIPKDVTGLQVLKNQKIDDLVKNGLVLNIKTGITENEKPKGQYGVIAFDKIQERPLSLTKWAPEAFDATATYCLAENSKYYIYYLDNATYDVDLDGTNYKFEFKEEED